MKQICCIILILCNFYNPESISKEKKILGDWTIIKTLSIEKIGDNLYKKRTSGLIDNMKISFRLDNVATALDKDGKVIANLFWKIDNGKIQINYNGDNPFLKYLNGNFEMKFSKKMKLELVSENNYSVFLER